MVRFVLLIALFIVAVGIGYVSATHGAGTPAGERLIAFLPFASIAFGGLALLAAYLALRKTASFQNELRRLSQSIEVSLREIETRSSRDAATISEMNQLVARELKTITEAKPEEPIEAAVPVVDRGNVVKLVAPRRARPAGEPSPAEAQATEAAFRAAIASGEFEISLQPIVSVARSVAAGFEVFAHLSIDGGPPFDIRRAPDAVEGADRAAFERRLVLAAAEAARRRVGAISESMPLHVAVSPALLASDADLAEILDVLALYPAVAKSLVLSLPVSVAIRHAEFAPAAARLVEANAQIAVEGWPESTDSTDVLRAIRASQAKLPVNRLLDRDRGKRKLIPASTIVEAAAADDILLIATDVGSDEDVVSLIDLGVDLMSGERFSGPRRLKPEGSRSGRLAQN
ncbi:MAG: EAL domain-containing protein [Rhizobiaceae bacterium]